MRDRLDKIARIALALQRAGGDHLGSVESLHQDFQDLLKLLPQDVTVARVTPAAVKGQDVEQQAQEDNVRLQTKV